MATPQQEERTPAQVSGKPDFAPIQHKSTQPPLPPSANSSNKTILDSLLHRSIQSRLKQAQVEYLEMTPSLQHQDKETIQEQKQRWVSMMTIAEQDKNTVESIVKGILSNHRSKRPLFQIDNDFEQRLHLCQLTNLIFGRLDTSQNDVNTDTSSSNKRRRRHHHHHHHNHHHHHHLHQHLHLHHQRHEPSSNSPSEQITPGTTTKDDNEDTKICRWTHMITPNHCRRHRLQRCGLCDQTTMTSTSSLLFSPGLLEAIPTFLKTSADLLRHTLETNNHQDSDKKKPMIFAGQNVMGGGMPPRWYDLFLELLTQAAIECYLCDMQTGLESIYEIFSYGDVEDEDEPEHHTDEEDYDDDGDDEGTDSDDIHHLSSTDEKTDRMGTEHAGDDGDDDDDDDDDDWSVEAADHHLLFPKTRTMYLFKTQVREREKEILVIEENATLHQHFLALAKRYPLDSFEKNMGEYIQMIHHTMTVPDSDSNKDDHKNVTAIMETETTTGTENGTSSKTTPSIYKYPCDGSLLMPELPDAAAAATGQQEEEELIANNKRRASVDLEKDDGSKKHG